MSTTALQETYLNGREKANELGSDINEYTRVLYGVSHVLKNRGFNYTVNDLSNLFHSPLASIRASEQIEQIIKAMDATFADGLKRGKDSYDTTKAIDISTISWRTNRLYSAITHNPMNDVDGLIADHLKDKFPGIRRGTKQWKEESEKVADKALKAARTKKINGINTELLEFKSWWDKDGQKLINTAQREADHTETQMKIIYALNPDSKTIQEAEEQIKSIKSRIINFQSSGKSSIKKAEDELHKLSEVQDIKKEIAKGETVEVPEKVLKATTEKKSKYFITVSSEYEDRSGYRNVRQPVEKAYPFTYKDIDLFASKDISGKIWKITEVQTGLSIPGTGKTKEAAIQAVKETIDRTTPSKIKELISTGLKRLESEGIEYDNAPADRKESVDEAVERIKAEALKGALEDLGKNESVEVAKKELPSNISGQEKDDETARFGEKVTVIADPDNPEIYPVYNGTIIRTLNKGKLIEVRPEGQTEGSFRVDAIRVVPVQEIAEIKKDIAKGETVEVPEPVISETVSDSGKQFIDKRAKHSEFGEVLVIWQNSAKNRALIQFDDGEKQETQMHKLRLLTSPEMGVSATLKEEIKQGEIVTIPETVLKEEIQQTPPVFEGIYTYYFRNRPPDIGTHPGYALTTMTWIPKKETPNGNMAWGYVTYDHKLSPEEIGNFELFVDDIEMPAKLKDLVKFTHDEGIDEAMKEVNAEYGKIILNWMKANKRYPASRQKEAIRTELMQLAGITEKTQPEEAVTKEIKQDIKAGKTVTVPAEVIESTPETDWNYSLKKALKVMQDERKKTYPTTEAFRESRTKHADLLESDFHLKSHKDKAEQYKPGTIQYNKHMAEYKDKLKEIAELRKEAEAGKTIQEIKLEETMRQNDEQSAEESKSKDKRERLKNTDTETLKERAFEFNKIYGNETLSKQERNDAKGEIQEILYVLRDRKVDITGELNKQIDQFKAGVPASEVREIKKDLNKGETVTIPETALKIGDIDEKEIDEGLRNFIIDYYNKAERGKRVLWKGKDFTKQSADIERRKLGADWKIENSPYDKDRFIVFREIPLNEYIKENKTELEVIYKKQNAIKNEISKGETVTVPETVLKATVDTEPDDIEKSKYTYPLSPEEIKENELSGGIEIHNIGGPSKLNSKGEIIGSTDLGQIRLKNGKYRTEYQGKEGWTKGLSFDNYIHAHRYVLDKSGYKPIIDIKKELAKGEAVEVPETVLKATIDTEPSAEVKEWFDKAYGIKDYKGGRNDRRSILGMLINAMPYGNVKSFNDMAKMAKAIGKDLGYGEPTSGTWERHFAEQIANETGRDVSIIGNAMVVHPGNKQSLKLPDGRLKPMSESKKPEVSRKPVEELKAEIEVKEKIDTGDAVLDELLEQSDWMYRAKRESKLRPEARKYTQAVYNYLLHGGEDPDIPVMLKPHSTDSTDEYIALDANLKSLFQKAGVAAKKTKSLQKKQIDTLKATAMKKGASFEEIEPTILKIQAGETVVIPETILKKEISGTVEIPEAFLIPGLMKKGMLPEPDWEFEKRLDERIKAESEREEEISIQGAEEQIGVLGYDPITGYKYSDEPSLKDTVEIETEEQFKDLMIEAMELGALKSEDYKRQLDAFKESRYPEKIMDAVQERVTAKKTVIKKEISAGETVTIPGSVLKTGIKKELTFEEVGKAVEREMSGKRLSAKALKDYIETKHGEGMPRGWVETHYLRVNHPTTTELEKDITKIEKQLEKTYHTVTSRAQATTREAQSGKLAQVLDAKKSQLKKIVEEKVIKGATATVPESTLKVQMQDSRTDAQIIKDLAKEETSPHRRPYSKLTPREKEVVDKATIQQYPVTSAHIGALVTISGTKDEALRSFDRLLRQGQTVEVPQRNIARLIEPPRLQIAAPAPSGTHAISVYSAPPPSIERLHKGEIIELPESSFRVLIQSKKATGLKKSEKVKTKTKKHEPCKPPVKVRAYDRGCPIKRGK